MSATPASDRLPVGVLVVHVLAALFWAFIGLVGGEMSLVITGVFGCGALLVFAGLVLFARGHARARQILVLGDAVPLAAGLLVLAYLVVDALRHGTFGSLFADSGAALALYGPAAVVPLLLALSIKR